MLPRPFRFSSPLQRDLAVGGTIGAAVCSLAVVAGITIGPTLGHKLPQATSGQPVPDVLSLPRVEHPALVKAEAAPRRRSRDRAARARAGGPSATSIAQPTVRREPALPGTPGLPGLPGTPAPGAGPVGVTPPGPGGVSVPGPAVSSPAVPVTVVPAGSGDEPVAVPVPGATTDSLTAAKSPRPVAAVPAAKGLRLRVASVTVVRTADPQQPALRVDMAITGATAGSGVPDQVALQLLPELPSSSSASTASTASTASAPSAASAPLALHANVDVVASAKASASAAADDAPPLDMRVRMAVAATDPAAPTVSDGGDGDGKSNVIHLTVPLSAFTTAAAAPDSPDAAPGTPKPDPAPADDPDDDTAAPAPGTDTPTPAPGADTPATPTPAPGADPPATPTPAAPETPATPPADAPAPKPIEVRLALTAPAQADATPPTETTQIPVPPAVENPDVIVDPLPVTVTVDSAAAPSTPSDVITDLPVVTAPAPADAAPVPGLGDLAPVDASTVTSTPAVVDPAPTAPVTTPDPATAPTPDTGGIAAPDPAATPAP
ncbi:MAG: hypothetical protein QOJ21_3159 [Solirubrobacteraceae bacterium]|nr:hypothetical protein [Solirubrobacteraceae bacterium]